MSSSYDRTTKYPADDSTIFSTRGPLHRPGELDSLRAYLWLLLEAHWWILAIAAVTLCVGLGRARWDSVPPYHSEVQIQLEDRYRSEALAQLSPMLTDHSQAGIEIETLRSSPLLAAALKVAGLGTPIEELKRNLSIHEKTPGSGTLIVELVGARPEPLTLTLNAMLGEYFRYHAERRSKEIRQANDLLQKEIQTVQAERDAAEAEFEAERARAFDAVNSGGRDLGHDQLRLLADGKGVVDPELVLSAPMRRAVQSLRGMKYWEDRLQGLRKKVLDLKSARADPFGSPRLLREVMPPVPVGGHRLFRSVLLWLVLGLGMGVVAVFARDLLRPTVKTSHEVERVLGAPVLVTVPYGSGKRLPLGQSRAGPLALCCPADAAMESLRRLRTTLLFKLRAAPSRVIAIAGPAPGAGASFTAVNMACLMADAGRRVLLVDGDLRQGELHRLVDQTPSPGLTDLLVGTADLNQALRREVHGRLDLLPTGGRVDNPSELLMSPQLSSLLEEIAGSYDVVIIDCPPILSFADAGILGGHAGTNLLLLRTGKSASSDLSLAVESLTLNGVTLGGGVLNGVPRSRV